MGILKKEKKGSIIIVRKRRGEAKFYTKGFRNVGEVCEILLSCLCLSLVKCASGNKELLEVFKKAAIQEIEKVTIGGQEDGCKQ